MSSHKTPYEIRLNLLELACRIEENKASMKSAHDFLERGIKDLVPTHTAELKDILDTAEELNKFVSKENKR